MQILPGAPSSHIQDGAAVSPKKNTGGKHWKKHWNNSARCWGFIPEIHQNSKEAAHFLTHLSSENHESGGSGQLYTNLKPGARFENLPALGAKTIPVPVEDAESGPQGIFLQVMPGALGQLSLGQLP